MGWLSLLKLFLTLATRVAGIVRAQKLMDAGEAKATAKSLTALSQQLGIATQLRAEVEAMSDTDLDNELRGD